MINDASIPTAELVETDFIAEELRRKVESGESMVRDVNKNI